MRKPSQVATSISAWYRASARDLPWRREPSCRDPYAVWVSEIMLQQTQVKTVIPYWERWMRLFPSVEALAGAPEQAVLKAWEGLGYYRRARNLHKAAQIIAARPQGRFPSTFEAVLELPGVGRYTAGAICSIAFGQAVPVLDGNVARVLSRLHAEDLTVRQLWEHARALVESVPESPSDLNQGLMELGATICTPRNPACPACPVQSQCQAFLTARAAEFPKPPAKPKTRLCRHLALILRRGSEILVRQRDAAAVNGGLWEFPSFELAPRKSRADQLFGFLGCEHRLKPFATIRHTITHHRITLLALAGPAPHPEIAARLRARWIPLADLDTLPLSSAHAQLRRLLQAQPLDAPISDPRLPSKRNAPDRSRRAA